MNILNLFAIMFYARLWVSQKQNRFAQYAITLVALQTYIALTSSYLRSEIIFPLISFLLGHIIGKRDVRFMLSYRALPYIIIFGLYAVIFSGLENRRSNFIAYFTEKNNNINPYVKTEEQIRAEKKDALLIRSANVAQLSNVVNLVNQNGLFNGRVSAPLVIAVIPRIFWPNKPKIQLGTWFALEIGQGYLTESGSINNSINMTIPGELYIDFGWIGVIIGSLLIGVMVAALWNATNFYSSDFNLFGILFGGYLLLNALFGIGADLQIVITFMSFYLAFFILKHISRYLSLHQQ